MTLNEIPKFLLGLPPQTPLGGLTAPPQTPSCLYKVTAWLCFSSLRSAAPVFRRLPRPYIEDKIIIEKAHRAKKKQITAKKNQTRTIICRLLNFKDKVNILKNCRKLKGTNIFVHEDFSQETLEHRRELWKEVKRLREEEDKIAYLNYRSIVVRSKNTER